MGRYYSGDIEGKFWFGVQSSDAADRFGVEGYSPSYIEYDFEAGDLEGVEDELESIKAELGENLERLDKFFDENDSYNEEKLAKYFKKEFNLKLDSWDISDMLSEYADYYLGIKIRDCLKEKGYCSFTAEL